MVTAVGIVLLAFTLSAYRHGQAKSLPITQRWSTTSMGEQGLGDSRSCSVDSEGRFLAFSSTSSNLVPSDLNGQEDVFIKDLRSGEVRRLSLGINGSESNGASSYPAMSGDGRVVVFESYASNLVPGDTNSSRDVFVVDLDTMEIERLSVSSSGAQASGESFNAVLDLSGGRVAFTSDAPNLVGGDTNGVVDLFLRDRASGTTTRLSVSTGGTQGNFASAYQVRSAITPDGRFVAFQSFANNLVQGDTNNARDIFLRDTAAGTTIRVSLAFDGSQGNGDSGYTGVRGELGITADGRQVCFSSLASNLVPGDTNDDRDIFVRDWVSQTTERISLTSSGAQGNGASSTSAMSADGRWVYFDSSSSNLVPGDTNLTIDVFLRDRLTGVTSRSSVSTKSGQADRLSHQPACTADGSSVFFVSAATNLVPADTNGLRDIFSRGPVRPRAIPPHWAYSEPAPTAR